MTVSVPKLKECGVNFQASLKRPGSLRRTARQFLLTWSCFGTRIIRDMTLHSAVSFGNLHYKQLSLSNVVWLFKLINTDSKCFNITLSVGKSRFPPVPLSRLFDFTIMNFFVYGNINRCRFGKLYFLVSSYFAFYRASVDRKGERKIKMSPCKNDVVPAITPVDICAIVL